MTTIVAALGIVLWGLFSKAPTPPPSVVDEVPASIYRKIEAQLVITPKNEQCINLKQAAAFPPCFEVDYRSEPVAFLLHPVNSILELF